MIRHSQEHVSAEVHITEAPKRLEKHVANHNIVPKRFALLGVVAVADHKITLLATVDSESDEGHR